MTDAMTYSSMNTLAILAIGCGFGLALSLTAVMVYLLHRAAASLTTGVTGKLETVRLALSQQSLALEHAKGELAEIKQQVLSALSRLDADQLQRSSLSIQRAARTLGLQVETLQKALFASTASNLTGLPPSPGIDLSPEAFGLDEEAAEDARMMQERERWRAIGRAEAMETVQWQQQTSSPPDLRTGSPANYPSTADPFADLSPDEKAARVNQFFSQRRREAAAANPYGIYSPGSPPVTVGRGAYHTLEEEVTAQMPLSPAPSPGPPDFTAADLASEPDVTLTEKGELD